MGDRREVVEPLLGSESEHRYGSWDIEAMVTTPVVLVTGASRGVSPLTFYSNTND